MKKEIISQRIAMLREVMKREHLAAFIFLSTDPHNGEYIPDHWKGREWISGFDGSAGTAVVTMHSAALWTDSRYFLAAEEQLRETEYVLMKERIAGTPSIAEWLKGELSDVNTTEIGIDGMTASAAYVESLISELRINGGFTLRTNLDVLEEIWNDRPPIPQNNVELYPLDRAGESTASKLSRIRKSLRQVHADGILVTALDDIAWTLNLRGSDVHCNPVFVSYLLIDSKKATLYINKEKLSSETFEYLNKEGVYVGDYEKIRNGLKDYFEYNILLDSNSVNYSLFKIVERNIVRETSPIPSLKCVKNNAEIKGFRNAMLKDGIAMTKFLAWLIPAVQEGNQTELSVSERLEQFRAEQPDYRGLSFDTISAYQEHGAIVHYEPTHETNMPLKAEGLLLLDSGAQYIDGTTDITRTIALGNVTEEQRRIYTLVLKGHIQLQLLKFPKGACGTQLDALARKDMWREGYNYMHGTGHGVGAYLNVHEGPHQIRQEYKPEPLRSGMTVTDEPGIYLANRFGVRIENTLLVVPYKETEFGEFLQFETLTLCPIDKKSIEISMLTDEEKTWLNAYHCEVYSKISPYLSPDEKSWLKEACSEL